MSLPLQVNPETGFLESPSVNGFTSDRKKLFLETCTRIRKETKSWPDFGSVCESLGVAHQTFDRHLKDDAKFREEFRGLLLGGKWQLESNLFNLGTKKGFEALIWLRRWFPEEYNPEYQRNPTVNVNILVDKANKLDQYVEAEIISTPDPLIDKSI